MKIQNENEKYGRQKKREMKKKGVKDLGQTKCVPKKTIKPCFICKKKANKMVVNALWVQCCKCKHFSRD